MNTITLTLPQDTLVKLIAFYQDQQIPGKNPYMTFFAKTENCTISVYQSGKIVFQGKGAEAEARIWQSIINESSGFQEHAGSDEVGTGDYFGPVCVCACIVTKEAYEKIRYLGIDDSKKLTDSMIQSIAGEIKEAVCYSLLILPDAKYNEIHHRYNMNGIKAMLHNKAYLHLKNKAGTLPELCVVDQFTPPSSYYRYLQGEPEIIRSLHFETKAESKYLAVACASVIARDAFLEAMKQLSDAYGMALPLGAGENVDQAIQTFVERHGYHQLKHVAKLHFANTAKAVKPQQT